MNVFSFTARIGKDCETRFTSGGDAVTGFTAAATSGYGDRSATTWVNCSIWGKRGESLAPYILKGAQVAISGELTNREYTDKDGAKRYSLDVRVNDITLVGGKSDGAAKQAEPAQKKPSGGASTGGDFDDFESDIPFTSCSIGDDTIWRKLGKHGE